MHAYSARVRLASGQMQVQLQPANSSPPSLSTRPTCEAARNHWVAGLPACCILPCAGPGSARGRRVLLLLSLLGSCAACNWHILPLLSLLRHAAVKSVY